MKQNDELFKQSRIIRQLVNKGKTYEEITSDLNLSMQQIKYRITSRYSEKIAHCIFEKLENNAKKRKTAKKEKKSSSNTSSLSFPTPALVMDTSALNYIEIKDFVTHYASIILTLDVIVELDNLKKNRGFLGFNIRFLLSESAKDTKNEKYHVVVGPKVSSYTDDNLIAFCRGKDVCLCTADNALANKAKAYEIPYLLVSERFSLPTKKNESSVAEENISVTTSNVREVEQNLQDNVGDTTLNNVSVEGKFLVLNLPDTYKIAYAVLDTNNTLKKPFAKEMISLKIDDKVLVFTYKEKYKLCIAEYKIVNLKPQNHATFIGSYKVSNFNDINKLNYPDCVLRDIRKFALSIPNNSNLQYL